MYSETKKYSKFVSEIEKILNKHPVKKLCCITLDTSDPYGTVTYKIDRKSVKPGTYKLREEQELEISYTITDGKHVIARDGKNLFDNTMNKLNFFYTKTSEKVKIPITSSLNDKKITRDMYIGIMDK